MTELVPTLLTERLRLRGWFETDRPGLTTIKTDSANWRFIGDGRAPSAEQAAGQLELLQREWRETGVGSWAVVDRDTGQLLGDCGIKLTDRGPQLAYMISGRHWGRGFATEASRAVLDYVFGAFEWPGVRIN